MGHHFRTHSTAKNVVPPRASQFIRPDLSSILNPFPSSVSFAYEAPADPETNGDVKEAETAAFFSSFVLFSTSSTHELDSTVLCKRAPSTVEQLKMVPDHNNLTNRFMITTDTKLTKFTIKPLDTIVSSAFGAEELFANVRRFEVIAVEKDLHTRELVLKNWSNHHDNIHPNQA